MYRTKRPHHVNTVTRSEHGMFVIMFGKQALIGLF